MNYIGSKQSLLNFIVDSITSVVGNNTNKTFADLFAGTGAVSKKFRELGYRVISNDIQYYSFVLLKHYIENDSSVNLNHYSYLNFAIELPASLQKYSFIYNNYCMGSGSNRNYFSDYNGKKCDAIRYEIENLHNQITEKQYYGLLASLLESVDKCANTASVYAAFLKKIKKSAQKEFQFKTLPIINGPIGTVYNMDANDLIKEISGDILYLDPPYNERQYCAYYHILETIARMDFPEIKGKTGVRDYSDQKSTWCSKKTAVESLEDLIKNANFKYIFLSYNNEGLISPEEIKNVFSKYGEYKLFTKEYKRFKADKTENRNHKTDVTIEYLHCLIKNNNNS